MDSRLISQLLFIILVAFLQNLSWLAVGGIKINLTLVVILLTFLQAQGVSIFDTKPNLALLALAVATFFINSIWEGLLFVSLATLILKFSPGFEKEILCYYEPVKFTLDRNEVEVKNQVPGGLSLIIR